VPPSAEPPALPSGPPTQHPHFLRILTLPPPWSLSVERKLPAPRPCVNTPFSGQALSMSCSRGVYPYGAAVGSNRTIVPTDFHLDRADSLPPAPHLAPRVYRLAGCKQAISDFPSQRVVRLPSSGESGQSSLSPQTVPCGAHIAGNRSSLSLSWWQTGNVLALCVARSASRKRQRPSSYYV
jgi:hypothetical protein